MLVNKNQPNQCYLCFSECHPEGIVLISLKDIRKLKQPVTKQAFPIELKEQLKSVILSEAKRLDKMH